MNTKLLSKEVIRELLAKEYDNDPRITDELIFDGKRLTLQGYILLKAILPKADYYSCCLDKITHHCYLTFEFDDKGSSYNYDDSNERAVIKEKLKPVIERLESVVSDNECYFISDVINGERDDSNKRGNQNHSWTTNKRYYIVDIWLFSRAGDVMEFAGDNNEKCKLLLETL